MQRIGGIKQVILLVEEGNVTVDAVDSWGHTPEGDARLAGYHAVAQYLQVSAEQGKPGMIRGVIDNIKEQAGQFKA
eukprot:1160642-Pelagomonas_calceolata.AAC.5